MFWTEHDLIVFATLRLSLKQQKKSWLQNKWKIVISSYWVASNQNRKSISLCGSSANSDWKNSHQLSGRLMPLVIMEAQLRALLKTLGTILKYMKLSCLFRVRVDEKMKLKSYLHLFQVNKHEEIDFWSFSNQPKSDWIYNFLTDFKPNGNTIRFPLI